MYKTFRLANICLISTALNLVFSPYASAAVSDVCIPVGPSVVSVPLPNSVVIQRDLPIGGIVAFAEVQTTMKCKNSYYPTGSLANYYKSSSNTAVGVVNGAFKTSIPGVGLRWYLSGPISGRYQFSSTNLNDTSTKIGVAFPYSGGEKTYVIQHTFEIIKTGSVSGGSFKFPNFFVKTSPNSFLGGLYEMNLNSFTFPEVKVMAPTCQLIKDNISVVMGRVNIDNFRGPGSFTKENLFSIDLRCEAGTRINLTLDNTYQINEYPGAIRVSNALQAATGVGIQILRNSSAGYNPVKLGESQIIGVADDGINSIKLAARYVQTGKQISGGQANGALTFVLNYQ